jgi:hypothetical protein
VRIQPPVNGAMLSKTIPYPSLRVEKEAEKRDQKESEEDLHVVK